MGFIYGGSTARSKQCLNFKQYNIICWILETCGLADLQSFFFLLKKLLSRRFLKASSLAGWTFVFACLQLQPGTSIFHPSTQTNTSCCFKGGYLVLNRAECVLGGACQRQPQLSGRFKMAELRTTVVFRERCPLRDALAALTRVPCF